MNALHNAYATQQQNNEPVRETEARALLSCACKLEDACQPDIPNDLRCVAIRHNLKLWTLFQASLCEPENALPRDLKNTLLNLCHYVDKTSFKAMSDENPALLRSLININRIIAAGLNKNNAPRQETSATTPATQQASVMTSA